MPAVLRMILSFSAQPELRSLPGNIPNLPPPPQENPKKSSMGGFLGFIKVHAEHLGSVLLHDWLVNTDVPPDSPRTPPNLPCPISRLHIRPPPTIPPPSSPLLSISSHPPALHPYIFIARASFRSSLFHPAPFVLAASATCCRWSKRRR